MFKVKSIQYIMFLVVSFIMLGCAGSREPIVPQVNSGIKQTKQWVEYNKYAEESQKPILDFVATSFKKPPKNGKILNYDNFQIDDSKVYVITKWHNVKKNDILEIKIYQPDGRLSYYGKQNYKFNSNKWVTWNTIKVKMNYPAKNIGTWKTDILMNHKIVTSKKFHIGIEKKVLQLKTNKTVGVFPFYDSEMSNYKFGYGTSAYIGNGVLYYNKNVKIIPNGLIYKDLLVINTTYKDFDKYIQDDLNSSDSVILNLAKKHNMNYAILGKIQAVADGPSLKMTFVTFIVDTQSKKIIRTEEFEKSVNATINFRASQDYWDNIYAKVYEDVLKSILPNVKNF